MIYYETFSLYSLDFAPYVFSAKKVKRETKASIVKERALEDEENNN